MTQNKYPDVPFRTDLYFTYRLRYNKYYLEDKFSLDYGEIIMSEEDLTEALEQIKILNEKVKDDE